MKYTHQFSSIEEASAEGYRTGVAWENNYTPGGPHVFTYCHWDKAEWKTFCEESRLRHDAWKAGFKRAITERGIKL